MIIPKVLTDQGGVWQNFETFLNEQQAYYQNKVDGVRELFTTERSPVPFEIAYLRGAYIATNDTAKDARDKTYRATTTHKNLPVFSEVYKPVIDSIVGTDSEVVKYNLIPEVFIVGQSFIGLNATIGVLNPATYPKLKGQILIDVKTDVLPSQIDAIRRQLTELSVMYFDIYIGRSVLITGTGFVIGSSLIAGPDKIGYSLPVGNYFKLQYKIR